MKDEIISVRQGVILIILFTLGSAILIGTAGVAKQNGWIAIIIALLFSIILMLMFSRILSLHPGKDLFDILEIVMGKALGKILSMLMIWFAFHLGALVMRNLSEYTSIIVFTDTPVVVPMGFFVLLLIWALKEGIEVMARWSEFFIWIVMLIFILVSLLSIPQLDISKLKPIFGDGFAPILKGTFSAISFPFGEIIVFTMVFSNISKTKNYNKIFIIGLLIGGITIFLAKLRNLLVLGSEMESRVYFPSTMAISLIHVGRSLERLEMGVTIILLLCSFTKIMICIFAVCNGLSKVFGFDDYRFISTPVTLLMFSFSFMIYKNTMEMSFFAFEVWPYYSFPFEVILPFLVFIMVEIRNRRLSVANIPK